MSRFSIAERNTNKMRQHTSAIANHFAETLTERDPGFESAFSADPGICRIASKM